MKNKQAYRVIGSAMGAFLVLGSALTGCGRQNVETPAQNASVEEATEQSQEAAVEPEKETAQEEEIVEEGIKHTYLLPFAYEADRIFSVDDMGNAGKELDFEELKASFEYVEGNLVNSDVEAVSGDLVIVCDNNYNPSFSEIYAYNMETQQITSILSTDVDYLKDYIDIYEGKIYIGAHRYKSDDNTPDRKEYVATEKEDGSGFDVEECSYPGLEGYYEEYSWESTHKNVLYEAYDENHAFSVKRTLDDCGFIVAHHIGDIASGYVKFDEAGNKTDLDAITGDSVSVMGYNKNWLVFNDSKEDRTETYNVLDFASGKVSTIDIEGDIKSMEILEDKCYFSVGTGAFGTNAANVYEYDFNSGEAKKVYSKEHVTLANHDTPDSCVIGHYFFYQKPKGEQLKWFRVDVSGNGSDEDTGAVIRDSKALKYGDITYDTAQVTCPFCGIPLHEGYDEAFVLKDEYSVHAAEINAFFEDELKKSLDYSKAEDIPETADECEYHKEYTWQYDQTDESHITAVDVIKDKYLTVDYESYWYGGGAHGMPFKMQYIFDLETGEQKTFRDFYSGTEEDFRKLVAEAVKEDFDSTDNIDNAYFAGDADEAYEQAYDIVKFDYANMFFTEDSVIYSFAPYDIGPYASGFIDVKLPVDQFDF